MAEVSPTGSKPQIGAILLAWLLTGGLLVAWARTVGFAIGAFYAPYAPFSPFGGRLFVLITIGMALSLPFAGWVTWAARRPGFRAGRAFAVFGMALLILLVGGLAMIEPLPSHTTLYIGETAYRVPTGYHVNEGGTQPGDDGFAIEFCREDLSSRYDDRHRGCETTVVGLSKSDKLGFDTAAALLRPGAGRITLDGWTVIVPEGFDPATGQTAGSGDRTFLVLDAEGRPFRAATCWSRVHCDVSGPTRLGFIWYQAAGDQPAPADWAAFEAQLLPLIESWRVPG